MIIILVGFLVFFNSFLNGFVWDDEEQVLNNSLVHNINNLPYLFMGSTFNTGGSGSLAGMYYKPMMSFCFSLLYSISGGKAFFFHFSQVLIHICNSIFIYLLFKKIFSKENLPLFLALIFLVHPLNAETAVYISALQDALFFFFGIIAFLVAIKINLSAKNYLAISFFILLSSLSKEAGFLFIPVIFGYRMFISRDFKLHNLKFLAFSLFIPTLIYFLLRFQIARVYLHSYGPSPIMRASLYERLISIPKIISYYLQNFVFPKDLAIAQHWVIKEMNFTTFYLPLIIILLSAASLSALFFIKVERKKYFSLIFFLFWFLIGLGLHLQIFPLDMTVADRWFYFPFVGLLGLIGIILSEFKFNKGIIYIGIIIILALSIRTIIRNSNWRDGLSIYSHDIQISKDAFDLENNFGVELFRNGKVKESEIHFQRSTELAPYWWTNWNNLGVITEQKGDLEKALDYYQKSIDNGNYYLGYENKAKILYKTDLNQARDFCNSSLKNLPNNSHLWFILALTEYKLGNLKAATEAAQKSYIISPSQQNYYLYSRLIQNLPLEGQL